MTKMRMDSPIERLPEMKLSTYIPISNIANKTSLIKCIPLIGVCLDSYFQHMYPLTIKILTSSIVILVSNPNKELL